MPSRRRSSPGSRGRTRGYLNFIIANGIVVTARYWREGLPESLRHTDQQAAQSLAAAFPNRRIVQVDALALNYEGGGLHCYSRNQPHADLGPR